MQDGHQVGVRPEVRRPEVRVVGRQAVGHRITQADVHRVASRAMGADAHRAGSRAMEVDAHRAASNRAMQADVHRAGSSRAMQAAVRREVSKAVGITALKVGLNGAVIGRPEAETTEARWTSPSGPPIPFSRLRS